MKHLVIVAFLMGAFNTLFGYILGYNLGTKHAQRRYTFMNDMWIAFILKIVTCYNEMKNEQSESKETK